MVTNESNKVSYISQSILVHIALTANRGIMLIGKRSCFYRNMSHRRRALQNDDNHPFIDGIDKAMCFIYWNQYGIFCTNCFSFIFDNNFPLAFHSKNDFVTAGMTMDRINSFWFKSVNVAL